MNDITERLAAVAAMDVRTGGIPAHTVDTAIEAKAEIEGLRAALETIADIAEGSGTVNSLPNIAKIARVALGLRQQHGEST